MSEQTAGEPGGKTGGVADFERIQPTPHRAVKILGNPWFGAIAALCSVISVPLSIYLSVAGASSRNLMFYASPTRTVVFKHGEASGLHVTHKGRELSTDITAMQVVVWNAGDEPIRPEQVLERVKLVLEPRARILDVRVRESTREVIGFKALSDDFDRGEIPLTWRILEQNDGAVLQVTYAGTTEHECTLEGVVEGQRSIQRFNWTFANSG